MTELRRWHQLALENQRESAEYKMMQIDEQTVVTLKYQLFASNPDEPEKRILLEERQGNNPLEFVFGQGVVVKKVEDHLRGCRVGFQTTVKIGPLDAFGAYRDDLLVWMDKEKFPKELDLQLGMKFQTQGPGGQLISVIVKDIVDDKVLIDGNHPLAGLELYFELLVLRVRKATPDEIQQKKVLQVLH